jgi:hypothetical protein
MYININVVRVKRDTFSSDVFWQRLVVGDITKGIFESK